MNNLFNKQVDLNKTPFYLTFQSNKIEDIGFEHWILDNLIVKNNYIKRMYVLSSRDKTIRGNHAHLNQFQILILISGKARVTLTNSFGEVSDWELEIGPVFIPPKHWIELEMDTSSKVICLASSTYSKLKTVHNKIEFLLNE